MKITKQYLTKIIKEELVRIEEGDYPEDEGLPPAKPKSTKVEYDGKTYLVSTADRTSSAAALYGEKSPETLVWDITAGTLRGAKQIFPEDENYKNIITAAEN